MFAKGLFMFFLFCLGALMFRSQAVPEYGRSAAETMGYVFLGLFTNHGDFDLNLLQSVFGAGLTEFRTIGPAEQILAMAAGLVFFHIVQYRQGLFERWRQHDPWLLILAAAALFGLLLPAIAVDSHQFIYFVF